MWVANFNLGKVFRTYGATQSEVEALYVKEVRLPWDPARRPATSWR